jgi:hypothetical protein
VATPLISGSVGLAGMNVKRDVIIVQHLLNRAGRGARLKEDGVAGHRTVAAIKHYQALVLTYPMPDGRVDPQGRMLRSLATGSAPRAAAAVPEQSWLDALGQWANNAWLSLEASLESWRRDGREQARRATRVLAKGARSTAGQPASGGTTLTDADCARAARRLSSKIDPLLVRAFAEKEAGGRSGFAADGRIIIAFEGHKFRKYTHRIYDRSHPTLSYPYTRAGWRAKWVVNNSNQSTSWRALETAMALDHDAALKSTSFGAFQVLGENHRDCGYPKVDDFVNLMKSGMAGQLEAFVLFCKMKPGLVPALERQDFTDIGVKYNGGAQEGYDSGLRRIYNRLKAGK